MKNIIILFSIILLFSSCKKEDSVELVAYNTKKASNTIVTPKPQPLSNEFKEYWYAGKAEISSYALEQARYGEIRKGKAVLIFVTEDFLPDTQVKANYQKASNIPVLKLNTTKNFNTGIYPYSIMQSTFYPVANNQHAIKVSSSLQEWCGHVYAQLNNRDKFNIMSHSYFDGEADKSFKLEKAILENELWTKLRIQPKTLPTGIISVVPSLEFTRLKHIPIKPYNAEAFLTKNNYTLKYKELNRTLSITFNPKFPYDILSWEESYTSGSKIMTTKATKLKTIKSPYWKKNNNKSEVLRDTLLLN